MSDEQVKGIQRYDFRRCKLHFDPHVCLCGKQARPEGEFVTFADHEQALAALEARNRELERKGEELCCAYGNALIQIHEADSHLKHVRKLWEAIQRADAAIAEAESLETQKEQQGMTSYAIGVTGA